MKKAERDARAARTERHRRIADELAELLYDLDNDPDAGPSFDASGVSFTPDQLIDLISWTRSCSETAGDELITFIKVSE